MCICAKQFLVHVLWITRAHIFTYEYQIILIWNFIDMFCIKEICLLFFNLSFNCVPDIQSVSTHTPILSWKQSILEKNVSDKSCVLNDPVI